MPKRSPSTSRSASRTAKPDGPERVAHRLLQIVDAALLAVFFLAPMGMGGRGPVGKLMLMACVAVAVFAWGARQYAVRDARWRWSGAEGLILGGFLLLSLQVVSLPTGLLQQLSPAIAQLLPLWRPDADLVFRLGNWSTVSLTPAETSAGLSVFLTHAALFLVLVQRLHAVEDLETWMERVALAVLWMAFLGVVQFLGGNGKFLWIYEHPSRDTWGKVIGTFQNQNHFAHFLALGIGPLIVWMRRRHGEDRQKSFHVVPGKRRPAPWPLASSLLAVGFGLTWAAAILTFSRGGALCLGIAAATCVTMLVLKRMLGWRSLCAAGGLGLVLFVALAIYGSDRLSSRLETLASGSLQVASQSRLNLWKAQWKAIPQFAWLGSGVGSHRVVYPIYMEEHHDVDFGYGENGYFQLLLETGVVGLTLVLTGFALGMRWAFGPWFRAQCDARLVMLSAAIVPGLIASLLHSAGDFVWYIPACASVTVFLLASACRVGQLSRLPVELRSSLANGTTRPRAGWMQSASHLPALGCMTLALLVGLFAVQFQLPGAWASPHWNRYLRLARAESSELAPLAGGDTDELARVGQLLELVVHRDPWNPRARLALASVK
ncbi:MAG: O-antigen ligase family protein, partial [Pirellulaceae bacterium]